VRDARYMTRIAWTESYEEDRELEHNEARPLLQQVYYDSCPEVRFVELK